jgi:hypothetical protein
MAEAPPAEIGPHKSAPRRATSGYAVIPTELADATAISLGVTHLSTLTRPFPQGRTRPTVLESSDRICLCLGRRIVDQPGINTLKELDSSRYR